jgi:hypothetical protein
MRVAHKNKKMQPNDEDLAKTAVRLERDGEWASAADAWNKVRTAHPLQPRPYARLMILYRKLKEYNKELKVINAAIRAFSKKHKESKPAFSKKVNTISRALLRATGLADKKGNNIYEPGEMARWRKRKEFVLKRIGNQ